MRILYVANIRLPSTRAHAAQIMKSCEAFARLGHEVELVIPDWDPPLQNSPFEFYAIDARFSITRLATIDAPWKNDLLFYTQVFSFAWSVRKYVRQKKFDVLYCRDEQVLAPLLLFLPKNTIVWESHDGSWTRLARFVARRARLIIVVSNGAKELYKTYGVSGNKILTVPNGVDLSSFPSKLTQEQARNMLGLPRNGYIALYIGRLDERRGVHALLLAANQVAKDIRIVIIGEGPLETECQNNPKVLFFGHRPYRELPNLLASADVLLLPQTSKGTIPLQLASPLKLFAYLAAQKPIIAADLPSIREIVSSEDVCLVQADSASALAKGMAFLHDNPECAKKFAERAAKRAREYDWSVRAKAITEALVSSSIP